jgi:hypothetical protein
MHLLPRQGKRIASEVTRGYCVSPLGGLRCYAARKSRIRLLVSVGRWTMRRCPTSSIARTAIRGRSDQQARRNPARIKITARR